MSKMWGKIRGGLVYSILIVGVLMAASTGIVGATVVTMGILSLPLMLKWNYNKKISAGIICASGTLGQIIPPSIVLVLLADIFQGANEQASQITGDLAPTPVSSVDLFAGAILPGILLVIMYTFWIFFCSVFKPTNFPLKNDSNEKISFKKFIFYNFASNSFNNFSIRFNSFWDSNTNRICFIRCLGSFINCFKKRNHQRNFKICL